MKVSEIKKAKEAAELLERRKSLLNDFYLFETLRKEGYLCLRKTGRSFVDEFVFSGSEHRKKFLDYEQIKMNGELEQIRNRLVELGVEEDVEY